MATSKPMFSFSLKIWVVFGQMFFILFRFFCGIGSYETIFVFVAKKFKDLGVATTCDVSKMNKQKLVKRNIIPHRLSTTKLWNMQATLCRS
jgi:hypothetical protein